ncbi:hypothetical protein JXM83_00585 [Candidatus Woesearchaeota archaeon]|nr:hypothetical protein [Candidatus Woesearchaeota archaeon]
MSKKAEMGIGTLVLFIAMILVAAIAAGVLIQTATTLQSKALETGSRSTSQIGTALTTIVVYGEDASVDNSVETLYQNVKLTPGSEFVNLNDSVITVDLKDSSAELVYDSTEPCNSSVNSTKFSARYLKNGSEHRAGYVVTGDVVQLCYKTPNSVREDSTFRITFIPKVGSVMTVQGTTPGVMTTTRVFLYP